MAVQVQQNSLDQFRGLAQSYHQQLDSLISQRDALDSQIAAMRPLVDDADAVLADLEVAP